MSAINTRTPRLNDLPALVLLEAACWVESLRASESELRERVERFPEGQLVLEFEGRVAGVIYSQRIEGADALFGETSSSISRLHAAQGSIAQLLAINIDPEVQHSGLGDRLLEAMLHRCSVTPGIAKIVAVSLCRDYGKHSDSISFEQYISLRDQDGLPPDPILRFHVCHGATIVRPVPGYRPGDSANHTNGVLIEYDVHRKGASVPASLSSLDIHTLEHAVRHTLGISRRNAYSPNRAWLEMGFDSLDLFSLRATLRARTGIEIDPTSFFRYATPLALIGSIEDDPREADVFASTQPPDATDFDSAENEVRNLSNGTNVKVEDSPLSSDPSAIAIIGMACRFPGGADTPEQYWNVLNGQGRPITEVPPDRWTPASSARGSRLGGFLDHVADFDAAFFRIAPREAASIDPQQRLLLEVSWEALERAGIAPDSLAGTDTGVFAGVFTHDYEILHIRSGAAVDPYYATGNSASVSAGRIAYFLGLNGPAIAVDTACSSSLTALSLACQALRAGKCGLSIVCGVNLMLAPDLSETFEAAGMLAPDGLCKTFDASADGYVRSEGCAAIVLKPLIKAIADNDPVLAVVRGVACNQDGNSNGLTAPNVAAQEAVIRKALEDARVEPEQVDAIECHGTGTSLGDPIEFRALQAVYGNDPSRRHPLVLTSAKTAIGHVEAAAGLAGVIKVLLSFQHAAIPPHRTFHSPNPLIDLASLPATVPVDLQPWPAEEAAPRIAGVSSFGFSGTNVHVILQEPPRLHRAPCQRPAHLFTLSAQTPSALHEMAIQYKGFLSAAHEEDLSNLAHTSLTGRAHFSHRIAFPAASISEAIEVLSTCTSIQVPTLAPSVAWVFTGQGAQYPQMGRELYGSYPFFRKILDECAALLRDTSLNEILWNSADLIHETEFTQPALFSLEYALARTWQSWGIEPSILLGHSIGEYVAACLAGVFSLEDALHLVAARGKAMQSAGEGRMAAVFASESMVRQALDRIHSDVEIAAINAPENIVISGASDAIEEAINAFQSQAYAVHPLSVRRAFHSRLMDPVLDRFGDAAATVRYHTPNLTLISNVSGELAGPEIATPEYWVRHLRQPVQFHKGIETIFRMKIRTFLESGPSPTLLGLVRRSTGDAGVKLLPSLNPRTGDWRTMLTSLAEFFMLGFKVNFNAVQRDAGCRKAILPTYPFERQRYWLPSLPNTRTKTGDPILDLLSAGGFEQLERKLAQVENLNEREVESLLVMARGDSRHG